MSLLETLAPDLWNFEEDWLNTFLEASRLILFKWFWRHFRFKGQGTLFILQLCLAFVWLHKVYINCWEWMVGAGRGDRACSAPLSLESLYISMAMLKWGTVRTTSSCVFIRKEVWMQRNSWSVPSSSAVTPLGASESYVGVWACKEELGVIIDGDSTLLKPSSWSLPWPMT